MSRPHHHDVYYPETDDLPMAENTIQYRWITTIHGGLDSLLPDAFVAGDLFWYPVEGEPLVRVAPDVLVALGRPKGDRPSFRQWLEGGPPEVVFEIRSPSNSSRDLADKLRFYDCYGVSEYYLYDPDRNRLQAWVRSREFLEEIAILPGWASPLLGIRFHPGEPGAGTPELRILHPDGEPFRSFQELQELNRVTAARAEQATVRAEQATTRAEHAESRAKRAERAAAAANAEVATERARTQVLAERLRALGVDPDAL